MVFKSLGEKSFKINVSIVFVPSTLNGKYAEVTHFLVLFLGVADLVYLMVIF